MSIVKYLSNLLMGSAPEYPVKGNHAGEETGVFVEINGRLGAALDTPARPRYHVARAVSRFATHRPVKYFRSVLCHLEKTQNWDSSVFPVPDWSQRIAVLRYNRLFRNAASYSSCCRKFSSA